MRHPLSRRVLALSSLVLALAACSDPPATLASLPGVEGAPVSITDLSARPSRAAVVGSAGVRLSSSSPPNALSVRFRVTARDGYPQGALVASRTACRFGDVVLAGPFTGDASLETLHPGESRESDATLIPSALVDGVPSACEVELRYQDGVVGPRSPHVTPADLGAFCWSGGALRAGRCPDAALHRASGATRVRAMRATIAPAQGGGHRLELAYLVQVGERPQPDQRVLPRVDCTLPDGQHATGTADVHTIDDLEPGESTAGGGAFPMAAPLPAAPQRCEIALAYGTLEGGYRTLATYCLRGADALSDGACD